MMVVRTTRAMQVLLSATVAPLLLAASLATPMAAQSAKTTATKAGRDSVVADSLARVRLDAETRQAAQGLVDKRARYLRRSAWADLGDRCSPGSLRIFPRDTSPAQRDSLQALVESMERTVLVRGVGARLDTPEAKSLLRTIVGWEAGIDRPTWDENGTVVHRAVAAGLTGDVPDPRGPGCIASPLASDTVTFVLPGFTDMEFPKAPRPRVKAYFGPDGQKHARDEFFSAVGSKAPDADLMYTVVAPIVMWREWALVGVNRPKERAGVEVGANSNGGAVYLMRRVGAEWRLLSVVRSWGS